MNSKTKLWVALAAPAIVVAVALGIQQGPSETSGRSTTSPFDAARAFADLETVVGHGARPAGSENIRKTRAYIVEELRKAGFEPRIDAFVAMTPVGEVDMANVRAVKPGSRPDSIAVGGHYDTKRFDFNFVGANDAGSSTALLLELARVSSSLELEHTLEFIFFDGEEAIEEWDIERDAVYGSRHDIDRRFEDGTLRNLKALVLVDMVGDSDLELVRESASTGWLKDLIWETAARIGYSGHFGSRAYIVEDDHVPYLRAGIPAIDLIDMDYPYWHTPGDTIDKTSPKSLKVVGDVVYNALPAIDRRLSE